MNIPEIENQYIEFKRETISYNDLAEEIVAFANGEGGEIWLGVEDDRTISGLSRCYEEDIMNIARNNVIPPINLSYNEYTIDEHQVASITIPKGVDKPYYTSRNRYYIRVGSTKRIASREELIRLFQASGLFHYDIIEINYSSERDLNYSDIIDYFNRYQFNFSQESDEERQRLLQASDILGKQSHPTVGGLLIFGIAPERYLSQAGIRFAHFKGREIDEELLDNKNFGGNLPRQIDNALAAIKANIPIASTLQGAKRVEAPHYPDKVFRELLVNACVHRNYSIVGSQIRVFLFEDRIEFISPGRLPNSVTIEKLIVGTSYARNPLLLRFMENLSYVERLGRGLPMVYREAKKMNLDLQFIDQGEEFRVILQLPNK
ncbi:RNA-binding domain-containing protein [Candidatus Marithrix sp. Canyon 246]|uniref:RNA-binding domain-containing protein n=1 Tax=Candidatus Marithrix sp. Canyon 246 TaxID=1827136 RepID=UPI000849EEF0|nr:RNA-binding domain-containing protein [Candidatus Marithrix sp. Canyon 246]